MSRLRRTEYDFTSVNPEEERTCALYEYARESEVYRKIAESQPIDATHEEVDLVSMAGSLGREAILVAFTFPHIPLAPPPAKLRCGIVTRCPGFPDTPWLDLSAGVRRWLNEGITNLDHQIKRWREEVPSLEYVGSASPGTKRRKGSSVNSGPRSATIAELSTDFPPDALLLPRFRINRLHKFDDIVKAFSSWLRTEIPQRRAGRRSYLDALHALALLRLRYSCDSLTETQNLLKPLTESDLGRAAYPRYSERSTFDNAAGRALRHFRELLGLPKGDKPLRYSAGWKDRHP